MTAKFSLSRARQSAASLKVSHPHFGISDMLLESVDLLTEARNDASERLKFHGNRCICRVCSADRAWLAKIED